MVLIWDVSKKNQNSKLQKCKNLVHFVTILKQNRVFLANSNVFFHKGIILPNGFLDSLEAAQAGCKAILKVYQEFDVQVLIESPTRSDKDYSSVQAFLGEESSQEKIESEDESESESSSSEESVQPVAKKARWRSKKK